MGLKSFFRTLWLVFVIDLIIFQQLNLGCGRDPKGLIYVGMLLTISQQHKKDLDIEQGLFVNQLLPGNS